MKKLLLLLTLALAYIIAGYSQSRLTFRNNAYKIGDKQSYILVNKADPGNSGSNQTWDFSALKHAGELISAINTTSESSESNLFPKCNTILREGSEDFFYQVTDNGMYEYGSVAPNKVVCYTKPIVKFTFPFVYGASTNGSYSGTKGQQSTTPITGEFSSIADGYGSLILPDNVIIHDVLRVKFVRTLVNRTGKYITYRWYAGSSNPNIRFPLLSLTVKEVSGQTYFYKGAYMANAASYVNTQNESSGVTKEYSAIGFEKFKVTMYPNPFRESAQISYTLPAEGKVTLFVSDFMGRIMQTLVDDIQSKGEHIALYTTHDTNNYNFVTLVFNGKVISSQKLIRSAE